MSEQIVEAAHDTGVHDAERLQSDYWMQQRGQLFLASCIALIVTAMSFAIRGDAIAALGKQFVLTNEQLGWVALTAFWGFTLAMMIGGPLCDVLGMGRLLWVAIVGHFVGIVMTIFATGFWPLFISTLIFGLANGCVEAACNPLIATLYPDQKIKRLNLFHVWFPGGIVIGGLAAYAITQAGIGGDRAGNGRWRRCWCRSRSTRPCSSARGFPRPSAWHPEFLPATCLRNACARCFSCSWFAC